MTQARYDLCRSCTRPVPPGCDFCATCGDAILSEAAVCGPPPLHHRRLALEGSVRLEKTLPFWTSVPLAILALGVLLGVIRFLSSEPAQAGQLVFPTQQRLSEVVDTSTSQRLSRPEISKETFVNAYVTANLQDRDFDGYTAAEIAELAEVEFNVRSRTCGPTIVCDFETLSTNSRGMRAMRLIEAAATSALKVAQRSSVDSR